MVQSISSFAYKYSSVAWIGWLLLGLILAIPMYQDVIRSESVEGGIIAAIIEIFIMLCAWILKSRVARLRPIVLIATGILGFYSFMILLGALLNMMINFPYLSNNFFIAINKNFACWILFILSWASIKSLKLESSYHGES